MQSVQNCSWTYNIIINMNIHLSWNLSKLNISLKSNLWLQINKHEKYFGINCFASNRIECIEYIALELFWFHWRKFLANISNTNETSQAMILISFWTLNNNLSSTSIAWVINSRWKKAWTLQATSIWECRSEHKYMERCFGWWRN